MTHRYYINSISEFYWEIVDRSTDKVVRYIEKTSDDDNRHEAERVVKRLNRAAKPEGTP